MSVTTSRLQKKLCFPACIAGEGRNIMKKFKNHRELVEFINESFENAAKNPEGSLNLGDYGIKFKRRNTKIFPTQYDDCFGTLTENTIYTVSAPGIKKFTIYVTDSPGYLWLYYRMMPKRKRRG